MQTLLHDGDESNDGWLSGERLSAYLDGFLEGQELQRRADREAAGLDDQELPDWVAENEPTAAELEADDLENSRIAWERETERRSKMERDKPGTGWSFQQISAFSRN